jgi:hypothetical protein
MRNELVCDAKRASRSPRMPSIDKPLGSNLAVALSA